MPRAALCLEGHWVKMRPGAAILAHPRRRMAVGCHRPRAQRGTSCCAVTGASSAALRGGKMFRLLAFFSTNPLILRKFCESHPVQRPRKCNQSAEVSASHPAQRQCNACANATSPQRSVVKTSTHGSALRKCKQSGKVSASHPYNDRAAHRTLYNDHPHGSAHALQYFALVSFGS